jgi:hypothetical protein
MKMAILRHPMTKQIMILLNNSDRNQPQLSRLLRIQSLACDGKSTTALIELGNYRPIANSMNGTMVPPFNVLDAQL